MHVPEAHPRQHAAVADRRGGTAYGRRADSVGERFPATCDLRRRGRPV